MQGAAGDAAEQTSAGDERQGDEHHHGGEPRPSFQQARNVLEVLGLLWSVLAEGRAPTDRLDRLGLDQGHDRVADRVEAVAVRQPERREQVADVPVGTL
jgi:hypothetical protein